MAKVKKWVGPVISVSDVFLPIWSEKKVEKQSKMSHKTICRAMGVSDADFEKVKAKTDVAGFHPTQLSPGEGVDDPDQDGDDDGTGDLIERAKNHLSAMADEDSVEASTERLAKAHALLSQALEKRRGGTHGRFAVKH